MSGSPTPGRASEMKPAKNERAEREALSEVESLERETETHREPPERGKTGTSLEREMSQRHTESLQREGKQGLGDERGSDR